MFTIHLKRLQFFSHHGIHEEERLLGNNFEVNVSVSFPSDEEVTTLHQTLDYAGLYDRVKKRMAMPTPLLERLAQDLAQDIKSSYPYVQSVSISIDKKNPPIPNIRGGAGVTLTRNY